MRRAATPQSAFPAGMQQIHESSLIRNHTLIVTSSKVAIANFDRTKVDSIEAHQIDDASVPGSVE